MSAKRVESADGQTLEISDIQATVLRPRPSPYKGEYIVLRIGDAAQGREMLRRIIPYVAPAEEWWDNQRIAIGDFREDKYNSLEELKKSTIPTLLIMGDHDISFHVEDWYPLIGDLESTQVIVLASGRSCTSSSVP